MSNLPSSPRGLPAQVASQGAWLRKHADYQRVYREGRRQSLPLMTYFFAPRTAANRTGQAAASGTGPRIGLTAGRVLGNAASRNRIKRRMREAVRHHRAELTADIDLILHPRKIVLQAEFAAIERDLVRALRAVQAAARPVETKPAGLTHERKPVA